MLEPVIPTNHPHRPHLAALRGELEQRWCAETSFWPEEWTSERPSVGQCAVTAMLVWDRFGGEMLRTVNQGVPHYWNRLKGVEVDLTRDQYDVWAPEEEVVVADRYEVESSGPTLEARYRRLVSSVEQ